MNTRSAGKGLTIGQLGRQSGLSRSTLLYYDRLGLLKPIDRSDGNYRLYSPIEVERLKQICFYRKMGIALKQIDRLLDQTEDAGPTERILQQRLRTLEADIESLQDQQREIIRLLEQISLRNSTKGRGAHTRLPRALAVGKQDQDLEHKENSMVNKKRWVEIMSAAGFKEQDMRNWHRTFEKMEPQGHQEFLESLGLDQAEITRIREWSRH